MAGERSHGSIARYREPALLDTSVAHYARVYNYWLGGKDNFAADRAAAGRGMREYPQISLSVRANRAFLARAVRFLAADAGVRQFLDIGTGIPVGNEAHHLAQAVTPQARVVYVDNDPIVLSHARALLASDPAGAVAYLDADLRDPQGILDGAARELDFSRPVAVILTEVLQHLDEADDPAQIISALLDPLTPGSYLAVSHPASDIDAEPMARLTQTLGELLNERVLLRSGPEVARLLQGLELMDPGLVPAPQWRPDSAVEAASPAALWAGVARKRVSARAASPPGR